MSLDIISASGYPQYAARQILSTIERSVDKNNICTVALSGGRTPMAVYKAMVELFPEFDINWKRVFFFWGDERFVPFEHPDSNSGSAMKLLLDKLPVPVFNIFPVRTDLNLSIAEADYEDKLRNHFEIFGLHGFSLSLLGLGNDCHTLSLFPKSASTLISDKWVLGFKVNEEIGERITLLPSVINNSDKVFFLITGKEKSEALHKTLTSRYAPEEIPAQLIRPVNGKLTWLVDEDAASLLSKKVVASQ